MAKEEKTGKWSKLNIVVGMIIVCVIIAWVSFKKTKDIAREVYRGYPIPISELEENVLYKKLKYIDEPFPLADYVFIKKVGTGGLGSKLYTTEELIDVTDIPDDFIFQMDALGLVFIPYKPVRSQSVEVKDQTR